VGPSGLFFSFVSVFLHAPSSNFPSLVSFFFFAPKDGLTRLFWPFLSGCIPRTDFVFQFPFRDLPGLQLFFLHFCFSCLRLIGHFSVQSSSFFVLFFSFFMDGHHFFLLPYPILTSPLFHSLWTFLFFCPLLFLFLVFLAGFPFVCYASSFRFLVNSSRSDFFGPHNVAHSEPTFPQTAKKELFLPHEN